MPCTGFHHKHSPSCFLVLTLGDEYSRSLEGFLSRLDNGRCTASGKIIVAFEFVVGFPVADIGPVTLHFRNDFTRGCVKVFSGYRKCLRGYWEPSPKVFSFDVMVLGPFSERSYNR